MGNGLSPYELARIAECAEPDSKDSPGAEFLRGIADAVAEVDQPKDDAIDTIAYDIANAAVEALPYSYDLWRTFIDLGAYRERDGIADAAEAVAAGDPDVYAAWMLNNIAYRLAYRLLNG
jgi:hypothetical protein